jgi:hypothetical protein
MERKTYTILLILLALIISSCEKDEIEIYNNSRLFFHYNCDSHKFNYSFIVNTDTIRWKENVLNCSIDDRAKVNKGDTVKMYFETEEPGTKELFIYINSHLWQSKKVEGNKVFEVNYIIE